MTRIQQLLFLGAALACLPACWTYSVYPLAEDNDRHLIYDPALEGKWQFSNGQEPEFMVITGDPQLLNYTLQLTKSPSADCVCGQDNELDLSYEGKLLQLGTTRFLDAYPLADAQGFGAFPAHNIFKISLTRNSLSMAPLEDGWLCSQPRPELGECEHRDFLLTAPTPVLQEFVQAHAADPDAFAAPGDDEIMLRVKDSPDQK
jgi:hypothetical protein